LQRRILNQDPTLSPGPRLGTAASSPRLRRRRALPLIALALFGVAALIVGVLLTSNGGGAPTVVRNSLVRVDPENGDVLDVIRVGRQPIALAVVGDFVWVSNTEEGTVMRVDPQSGQTDAVGGVRPPFDLIFDGQRHVWFSTYAYEQVTRVDTRTLAPDLTVPLHHRTFLLGTGAGSLWVTEPASNPTDRGTVARISLKTTNFERRFRVEPDPLDVKLGEGAAWVTNGVDASVSRIDLEDGTVDRIPIGSAVGPLAIAFGSLWITGPTRNVVWRLNPETRQVDDVIQLGGSPFNIVADAHGLWVALRESGTIVRIDPGTNSVSRRKHLGFKPQGLAVGGGALWVTVGHGQLGAIG
jgi:streptogramin lyase